MRKISADYVCPVHQAPIKEGVIILDEQSTIVAIEPREAHLNSPDLEIFKGILVPGFINTHCHLELSHMKGKVNTGTSLIPFISNVVKFRDEPMRTIQSAIRRADKEMYKEGIVAVGDISNKTDTKKVKDSSPIRYYTFVEMFDFLQDEGADQAYAQYKTVYEEQSIANENKKSCVPHAPYTVSKKLFQLINETNAHPCTVSIHNQETPPENELFLSKTGAFVEFYSSFGISLDKFSPNNKPAIHYAIENMDANQRTLFVHNTLTTKADIEAAQNWNSEVYWATCPNANLYIENRLPNYQHFIDTQANLTIGTDSLTSNWQLSIIEEMKTITRYQSYVPFELLLKWATLNGAKALGYENILGSMKVGKQPGINLIYNFDLTNFKLKPTSKVKRIV